MRLLMTVLVTLTIGFPAWSDEAALKRLETWDESRGWEAVGRLDLGGRGFCTGTLIAPDLVLTAAHCLYDARSGGRIDVDEIEFLAGWRNGRASAYRRVRRAVTHPDYVFESDPSARRVSRDLAVLELHHAVRNTTVEPFETARNPAPGARIGVVSYARGRAEAPSLQEVCAVRTRQQGVVVMTCDVDFGSSGAPVFSFDGPRPRVVSVISAKAEVKGEKVALGTSLEFPLSDLLATLHTADGPSRIKRLSGTADGARSGAKFVRP